MPYIDNPGSATSQSHMPPNSFLSHTPLSPHFHYRRPKTMPTTISPLNTRNFQTGNPFETHLFSVLGSFLVSTLRNSSPPRYATLPSPLSLSLSRPPFLSHGSPRSPRSLRSSLVGTRSNGAPPRYSLLRLSSSLSVVSFLLGGLLSLSLSPRSLPAPLIRSKGSRRVENDPVLPVTADARSSRSRRGSSRADFL